MLANETTPASDRLVRFGDCLEAADARGIHHEVGIRAARVLLMCYTVFCSSRSFVGASR